MRTLLLNLCLSALLGQSGRSQDVDPAFLLGRIMQLAAQNDSCVMKNRVSFQQSYRWTVVPISVEHAGVREITIDNGATQINTISKSGRELPIGSEKLFTRMAELKIANFLPNRIESTQCTFSPLGPRVMINGEVYYVLECHDRNPEFGTTYERTVWIAASTLEPVRIEILVSGTDDNAPHATRIAVEIARPIGFSCLVPLSIEQNDLERGEIGAGTVARLRIVNSNFQP